MELADRIKATRRRKGLTQGEFAQNLDTSQKVVSRWEQGVKPRGIMLERIAEIGNVTFDWLAHGAGNVEDAAVLSRDERRLLELYGNIEDKRIKYELISRLENAPALIKDTESLHRRIASVFFDQTDETRNHIRQCLEIRFRSLYDELARLQGENGELLEEYDAGFLGREVIENMDARIIEARQTIESLRHFDKVRAFGEIAELDSGDMDISILLHQLDPEYPI